LRGEITAVRAVILRGFTFQHVGEDDTGSDEVNCAARVFTSNEPRESV
jgi:hypothetical protein